jgi:hypothetical protein
MGQLSSTLYSPPTKGESMMAPFCPQSVALYKLTHLKASFETRKSYFQVQGFE